MANTILSRRAFVAASAATLGAVALAGCADDSQQDASLADAPSSSEQADSSTATSTQETSAEAGATSGTKTVVACFSATGNTRGVAQHLVSHLGADYVEIEPDEPYTEKDLNYDDETTRATVEQNDSLTRPALAAMPDFSPYDTVFLGHPIWWGKAPRLMCTLLEGCDLAGKSVAEFCTSGSSGIEGAASELAELAPEAEWIGAMRFAAGATKTETAEWAQSLDIQ